jgi:PleD family two-component response regulator
MVHETIGAAKGNVTMAQTILVVDDEAKLRDMIRVYLEQDGYHVVELWRPDEDVGLAGDDVWGAGVNRR